MAEKTVDVRRPLKSAIDSIGGPQTLLTSKHLRLTISKFPQRPIEHEPKQELPAWGAMKDHWVTGLTGVADHQYPKAGFDGLHRPLHKGDPWTIRWDYDEIKGSHVNLEWGPRPQSKIAFKAPPPPGGHGQRAAYYLDAIKDMTAFLGYRHHGAGTPGQRIHPNAGPSGNARLIEEDKWLHAAAIELANKWEALYAPQPVYHSTQKQH